MDTMKRIGALVVVALLVACGGGGKSKTASSTSSASDRSDTSSSDSSSSDGRSAKELAADKATAEAAILQLSDLPAGFTASPRAPSTADTPEAKAAVKKFADCSGVDPSLLDDDDSSDKTKARSDKFKSKNLEVESDASVAASEDEQKKIFESFKLPAVRGCFADFFGDAISFGLEHPSSGGTVPSGIEVGTIDVTAPKLPGLHADAVVYRASIPVKVQGQSVTIVTDFVLALTGRIGLTLTFQSVEVPFPQDDEVQLINVSIDRGRGG